MHDLSPKDAANRVATRTSGSWRQLRPLRASVLSGARRLVPRDFKQVARLLRPRQWRDAIFQSAEPAEPIGPILLELIGLVGPAGQAGPSAEVALEPKRVVVPHGTANAFVILVGRASLANRDSIVIQASSVELLLKEAIERPNSEAISDLGAIRSAISEFRQLLSGMPPADAIAGSKALSIRDGLLSWWNHDQLSILSSSFDMGLFAGVLALCGQAGLIPPAKVASLIRSRQPGEALGEIVKLLAGENRVSPGDSGETGSSTASR